MLTTTLKGLRAHKLRFLMTAVAVALGVAFMVGTMVLTDTITRTFDDLMAEVNGGTDAVVRTEAAFDHEAARREPLDAAVVAVVASAPGVAAAEGSVSGYAQVVDRDGEPVATPGAPNLALPWPAHPELNPFRVAEGRPPAAPGEVAVDRATARKAGLRPGDVVRVMFQSGPRDMRVSGVVTFGQADSPLGTSIALFEPATAQAVVGREGRFDEILVVAADGVSQEQLVANLRTVVPDGIEVISGNAYREESERAIEGGVRFFRTFLMSFAFVSLVVAAFIIANTFSMVVAQRRREMALLRALGATRRQVLRSVLGEAAAVGVGASILGIAAGIVMATGLKALFAAVGIDVPAGSLVVSGGTVAAALAVGVTLTVVSAVVPARKAGAVPPVAALRDLPDVDGGRGWVRTAAGLAVVALGAGLIVLGLWGGVDEPLPAVAGGALAVLLGMAGLGPVIAGPLARTVGAPLPVVRGMTGSLARDNASRNPKRTASTAAALMIGVSLVAFITVVAASGKASIAATVDDVLRADFVVTADSGLSPDLAARIRGIPGVEAVSSIRYGIADVAGTPTDVTAVDPATIGDLLDARVGEGSLDDLGTDGIAVHDSTARGRGWTVGDTVPATFAKTGRQTLTVRAIFREQDVLGTRHLISTAAYERHFSDQIDFSVMVRVAEGTDAAAVGRAIERLVVADFPTAQVQDRSEYGAAQAGQIDALLNLVYGLLLLAVVIALIGIANTLALSIFDRTRELGLLRAVGMTRSQLKSAVRMESLIIASVGTALGLAVGLVFGWTLVTALEDEGFSHLVVPVGQLLVVVKLAALAGVLAAVGPARRAARLDVLAAVSAD